MAPKRASTSSNDTNGSGKKKKGTTVVLDGMTWTNFKDNAKQLEVTLDHDDDSVDSKSIVLKPHKKKATGSFGWTGTGSMTIPINYSKPEEGDKTTNVKVSVTVNATVALSSKADADEDEDEDAAEENEVQPY